MFKNTSILNVQISSLQFSFELPGKIWKIVTATNDTKIIAEVREESEMSISYFLIDPESDELIQLKLPEIDWWSSLLAYQAPYLLTEHFQDPQNPLEKQLIIFDVRKSEIIEKFENFQFQSWDSLVIHGHTSGKPYQHKKISLKTDLNKTTQIKFAFQFDQGSSSHQMVAEFLEVQQDQLPSVEYLEFGEYIIICYYQRLGTKFARKLLVLKEESELCHTVIDEEMSGFAAGGFFILNQTLIYIEKSRILNGINLI